MIVALYIFLALIAVGAALWVAEQRWRRRHPAEAAEPAVAESEECCGQHAVCERDSLLAGVSADIEYFDDEELDAYAGTQPTDYTLQDIEKFRDVLLTLLPRDVAPWARSLQLRGIALPHDVREELLLIVAESRLNSTANA